MHSKQANKNYKESQTTYFYFTLAATLENPIKTRIPKVSCFQKCVFTVNAQRQLVLWLMTLFMHKYEKLVGFVKGGLRNSSAKSENKLSIYTYLS